MPWREATVALLMLAACGNDAPNAKTSPSASAPRVGPSAGAREKEEDEKGRAIARRVIECVGRVGSLDDIPDQSCFVPKASFEVVDHVPPIVVRGWGHVVSGGLGWAFRDARFHVELVILDRGGERAAVIGTFGVTGSFLTDDPGFALPVAATLALAPGGAITEARIWFDQRSASHQPGRAAPEQEKRDPQVIIARRDAAGPATGKVSDQFLAASREDDGKRLPAFYADDAVVRDEGSGPATLGATPVAGVVAVERAWTAGSHIVAELRRTYPDGSALSTLEILEVVRGRISRHRIFKNGFRADVTAGSTFPTRAGAAPILRADRVVLYKGIWRWPSEAEKLAEKVDRHGYAFHREPFPLDAVAVQRLSETLASTETTVPWFGEKRCGGFHPDYSVVWDVSGEPYEALVCFGCGELKWIAPDGKATRYDLTPWGRYSLLDAFP